MSIEHPPEHQPQPPDDDAFSLAALATRVKEQALQEGRHAPTLLIQGSASSLAGHFDELPDTFTDRLHLFHAAGQSLGETDTVGVLQEVVFITEAWLSQTTDPDTIQRPSLDPNRIEVLCIARLRLPQQTQAMVLLRMVRDETGQLVDIEDYHQIADEDEHGTLDSPLLDAFVAGYQTARARRTN